MRVITLREMATTKETRDTSRKGRGLIKMTEVLVLEGEAMETSSTSRRDEDRTITRGVVSLITTRAEEVATNHKITEEDMTNSRIKIRGTEEAILA